MHTSFASFQYSYFCLLLGQNFIAFCHGIGPREMSFGKSMYPSSFSVNVLSPILRQTEDIVLSLTKTLNSLNASVVYSVFSSIFLLSLCFSVCVTVCCLPTRQIYASEQIGILICSPYYSIDFRFFRNLGCYYSIIRHRGSIRNFALHDQTIHRRIP